MGDDQISRAFRALGHPHRLTIVRALLKREIACCSADEPEDCGLDPATCNVGELGELVDIAPSTLSRHLKELEEAGIIEKSREGRFIYCRVDRKALDRLAAVLQGGRAMGEESPLFRSVRAPTPF